MCAQGLQIIGKGMQVNNVLFEPTPQLLDRIQPRRISGKEQGRQAIDLHGLKHFRQFVDRPVILDHKNPFCFRVGCTNQGIEILQGQTANLASLEVSHFSCEPIEDRNEARTGVGADYLQGIGQGRSGWMIGISQSWLAIIRKLIQKYDHCLSWMIHSIGEGLQDGFPLAVIIWVGTVNKVHGSFSAKPKPLEDFVDTWFTAAFQPSQSPSHILQSPASTEQPILSRRLVQQVLNLVFGFFLSEEGKKRPFALAQL